MTEEPQHTRAIPTTISQLPGISLTDCLCLQAQGNTFRLSIIASNDYIHNVYTIYGDSGSAADMTQAHSSNPHHNWIQQECS